MRATFEKSSVFFKTLSYASEVRVQADKKEIGEDAVSAVIPSATIYMPFAELVDGQLLIAFGCGANVIDNRNPVSIILSEILDHAASAADHIKPHHFRMIFMLPESAEDSSYIFCCGLPDCR